MRPILTRTCVTFCCTLFSSILFAQAPDLGAAGSFVIFTTSGAVGNTGTSQLTGNVGTNTGAITAFGNVNGVMHNADDATDAAEADLAAAYIQLDTITPEYFPGITLGYNDTLTAGVYAIPANTSLSQTLTLNGGGDSGAVFIFQIDGTLSSDSSAQVELINGAQACNVFWKVEGLISLATGTAMKGTLLANNAAINIAANVRLEGRLLSTTGAININTTTAAISSGCGSAVLTGPEAPDLGTTECYALFTGNGANTNSGTSTVVGDVGTDVGLTTGYNPLTVTGMIHPIPDVSTAAAAADLIEVFTHLDELPHDIELLYPAQFGNSLVLTPHTYLLDAATELTDTLFLNAENNPDAVFVIKINGAFSTSTFANVVLVNGAQASNIFWAVAGAVSINNYSIFKGTVVSNNGAVNLNLGVELEGRAMTTNGAFSADAINTILPADCSAPLPVTWESFTGNVAGNYVALKWKVALEGNEGYFTVQKSTDGKAFSVIDKIAAHTDAGYDYEDVKPGAISYYRILHTDNSGIQKYSQTIRIVLNAQQQDNTFYTIYPNPVVDRLNVDEIDKINFPAAITIYNVSGSVVMKVCLNTKNQIVLNHLTSGMYYFKIESDGRLIQSGKFAK